MRRRVLVLGSVAALVVAAIALLALRGPWSAGRSGASDGEGLGEGDAPALGDGDGSTAASEEPELSASDLAASGASTPSPAAGSATGHPSDTGPISPSSPGTFVGVVVGVDGRPAAGASVRWTRSRDVRASGAVAWEGTTDEAGAFRADASLGRYDLRIRGERREALYVRDWVVDGTTTSGTFRLRRSASLVVVVTEEGRATAGADVRVLDSERADARLLDAARTDGGGRVTIEGVGPGAVAVESTSADGVVARGRASLVEDEERTIFLALPGRVRWSGVVRDADSRVGLAAAFEVVVDGPEGSRFTASGASDASGAFSIAVPAGTPTRVSVTAPHHEPFPAAKEALAVLKALAPLEAGSLAHDVVVRSGATLSGVVRGIAGSLAFRLRSDRGLEVPVRTDDEGRYTVDGLAPARYDVIVSTPGVYLKTPPVRVRIPAPTATGPASATLDVDVSSAQVVTGTVLRASGEPAVGARVWLVGGRGVVRGTRDPERPLETFAGSDGSFALDDVPPTPEVRVRASWGDAEAVPSDPIPTGAGAGTHALRLVVAPSVRVVGRVVDERSGAGVAGARVRAAPVGPPESRGRDETTTDADGRYELRNRIPGSWTIAVDRRGSHLPTAPRAVELHAGASPVTIDLTLDPGHPVAGVVLDERSAPLSLARVVLAGSEDGAAQGSTLRREAKTAGDGAFRFDALRAGRYSITVSHPGYAPLTLSLRGGEDRLRIALKPR